MGKDIVKIAVLPIVDKKLFLCRKKGLDFLVNLGGRPEEDETDEECAAREVREETSCGITNLRYFTTVNGPRGDISGNIELRCYFGDLTNTPSINPRDSIYEFVWIDRNWTQEGYKLPPTMQTLISKLVEQGHL